MNKTVLTKIFALVLALSMSLFVGCEKNNNSSENNAESKSGDYITTKGDLGAGLKVKNLKNKKLRVQGNTSLNALAKFDRPNSPYTAYQIALTWKETYGVEIEYLSLSADDLVAAYAADNMPDLISPNLSDIKNVAMDLKPLGILDDELLFPECNKLFDWAGVSTYIAGTKQLQRHYIIFNETRFVNEGQKTPLELYKEGNWTLSQFKKTAKSMTNVANDQYGFTGNELNGANCPYPACSWDESGRITLDLKNQKYITFMTEMFNLFKEDGSGRQDNKSNNWREEFVNGNDAMLIGNEYDFSEICRKSKLKGGNDFGIAPMFVSDVTGETRPYYQTSLMGSYISAKCKNIDAAKECIRIEAYVNRQMTEKLGQFGSAEQYLTKDEREALVESLDDPIAIRPLYKISSNSYSIIAGAESNSSKSGSAGIVAQLDSIAPKIKQEVDEYNSKIK